MIYMQGRKMIVDITATKYDDKILKLSFYLILREIIELYISKINAEK